MKAVVIACSAILGLVIVGAVVALILFLHQMKVDADSDRCRAEFPPESTARSECLFEARQW